MPEDRQAVDSPLVELLRYKWTIRILGVLAGGDHRFNELQRSVGNAPSNVLSERLKQLEREAIVSRTVEDTSPPQVTYALTERGAELADIVHEIERI